MTIQTDVLAAVAAAAPGVRIDVRFGQLQSKATWALDCDSAATVPQRAAAQAALDAFDLAAALARDAAEPQRVSDIDGAINGATFGGQTIASLKVMTRDQFNTWWAANVTTAGQAITVLKWIAWIVLRRI